MVAIIQEEEKACPDDTGKGGYITFTFRESIDLVLTSLLDIDDSSAAMITLTYNGQNRKTFQTSATGNNGFFPLNINTDLYKNVSMVDVKYKGSGSINSLVYRYCPKTPKPQIQIVKYAGPAGSCSSTDISKLKDDVYTVPSATSSWAYCYVISTPTSSEECLYDVTLSDPAPLGGIGSQILITKVTDLLCPGETIYISGPNRTGSLAPEGSIDATVVGTGYYSSQQVTDKDPAAVDLQIVPAPTIAPIIPTPPPTKCLMDMGHTDSTICPNEDVVTVVSINAENNRIIPENLDPSSIFYDLSFVGTESAPEVSFKIDNPFDFEVDMYIQYHYKAVGSSNGALDPACDGNIKEPGCNPSATTITAGCIHSETPFTIVSIFFVSNDPLFGTGSAKVTPYECCPIPDEDMNKPMIQYTFKLLCGCPTTSRQLLRGIKQT